MIFDSDKLDELSYDQLTTLLTKVKHHHATAYRNHRIEMEKLRRIKTERDAERRKLQEKESEELFRTLQIGDIVKVRGIRNTTYPYRRVDRIDSGSFSGMQLRRLKDGTYVEGNQFTTHMSNKIVEIVQKTL